MTVRSLSVHAHYQCQHRGRCCTSGWPIAVDEAERARLDEALQAGALRPSHHEGSPFALSWQADSGSLLASVGGRCVFHDGHAQGGCRIHRAMGHSAIPLACRQFPRQSLRDPRGVSVTLSHYCPTASDLLSSHVGEVSIVSNPPAFPADAEYVGFDADASLPPLLHPRLAMDWESWWLFEELSVSLLAMEPQPLARLALAVEHARHWNVGAGPLVTHVRNAFQFATEAALTEQPLSIERIDARTADALSAVPEEWRELAAETVPNTGASALDDRIVRRFLAAHAFGNWAAYQGEGLRTWFRAIETAACLLQRTQDPGQVDLVLRHLVDPDALVARWKEVEGAGAPGLQARGHPGAKAPGLQVNAPRG